MINADALDNLSTDVNPRVTMIGIINAANVSPLVKTLAYAAINTATDEQINKYKELLINSVGYIKKNDINGLTQYLKSVGLSDNYIAWVVKLVNANSTHTD